MRIVALIAAVSIGLAAPAPPSALAAQSPSAGSGGWSGWSDLLPNWIQYRVKSAPDSRPGRIVYFQIMNVSAYTLAATCSMQNDDSGGIILLFTERLAPGQTSSADHSGLAPQDTPTSGGCTLNVDVGQ